MTATTAKKRSPAAARRQQQRRRSRLLRICGLIAAILLMFGVLAVDLLTDRVSYEVGEIALEDVYYTGATTSYESAIATEQARNQAAAQVGQVFLVDETVAASMEAQLAAYAAAVTDCAARVNTTAEDGAWLGAQQLLPQLRPELPGAYSDDSLIAMLEAAPEELAAMFALFNGLVAHEYELGISSDQAQQARQDIAYGISASSITGDCETFFKTLLENIELPYNKAYDAVATRAAQDTAMEAVEAVTIRVQNGQKLLSRGAGVTAEQIEALEALGQLSTGRDLLPYLGLALLVALLLNMFFFYLRQFKQSVYQRPSHLLLIAALLLLFLLLAKLISLVEFGSNPEAALLICLLAPLPAASMLLAVLLDRGVAIVGTCVLATAAGVIAQGELIYALTPLVGGLVGILASSRLSQRSQFVGASLWIAGANVAAVAAWGLIWGQPLPLLGVSAIFALVNGLLSAILAMGTLPFLETAFGVTTGIRLLELSNSNNPLLKRLMMEAPGTYNHSILVGNLAEAAADAIQANPLLVRAAAYYHDIGKLKRPHFFIENQRPGENPHDKLQPALSAMIITSHPVDGARMLREARIPQEIIDIVEQHHGNSLLLHFYRKAQEEAEFPESVAEADFRYKGRRPQTREAGLLMLADSVQAAVQALKTADRAALEQRVHEVIQNKLLTEDQLRECPLTLADLDAIEQSFLMVLSGINHLRISYPDEQDKAIENALLTTATEVKAAGAAEVKTETETEA